MLMTYYYPSLIGYLWIGKGNEYWTNIIILLLIQVTIPFGQPAEFVIIGSDGTEYSLRADNGSPELGW